MSNDVKDIECEQAIRMVLEYLDKELRDTDQRALEQHIHKCHACYSRVEFEKRLKDMIMDSPEDKAPDALLSRIKNLTRQY